MMLYQLAVQLAVYSRLEGANVRGRIMIFSTGNLVIMRTLTVRGR